MMIKWKKQCELGNKNLRMKTEIEAISFNKRSWGEEKCGKMHEDKRAKDIK